MASRQASTPSASAPTSAKCRYGDLPPPACSRGTIMPLHIDHISLASPHIFRSADALARETGLGYWTGEWLGDTSVNIVPLGPPGNFIEISGFIDIFTLRTMNEHKQS